MDALKNANRVRLAGAEIRRQVGMGNATLRFMLEHPDCAHYTVGLALRALPGVGHKRAHAILRQAQVLLGAMPDSERRLHRLTPRQRDSLVRTAEMAVRR